MLLFNIPCNSLILYIGTLNNSFIAVSYTHLDVYKRQLLKLDLGQNLSVKMNDVNCSRQIHSITLAPI